MENGRYKHGKEIGGLQSDMTAVKKDISEIKLNHLTHIYKRLGKIETKIAYYAGGLAVLVILLRFIQ